MSLMLQVGKLEFLAIVKMPPKYAEKKELQQFRREMALVKGLQKHENILGYDCFWLESHSRLYLGSSGKYQLLYHSSSFLKIARMELCAVISET